MKYYMYVKRSEYKTRDGLYYSTLDFRTITIHITTSIKLIEIFSCTLKR